MATKTTRKLGLKKETLRQLNETQLGMVAGGLVSSDWCKATNDSGQCGSTTSMIIIGYDIYGRPRYSY